MDVWEGEFALAHCLVVQPINDREGMTGLEVTGHIVSIVQRQRAEPAFSLLLNPGTQSKDTFLTLVMRYSRNSFIEETRGVSPR